MDKLKEGFGKLKAKFKSFSKGVKIAIIATVITVIIAIVSLVFYSSSTKYQVLFSDLEAKDAQLVTSQLEEKKVDTKIKGNSIMVPKDSVDELRLELAPELSGGSQGYELMDSGSSFGMTDEEFQLKKLRMQQGELEKTIKSFSQIDTVRVHITPSKNSVFVEDKEPGKAAVYLKLMPGKTIDKNQVESIVALVSGSAENIPKENVEVIDDDMNLLTKQLNSDGTNEVSSESVEKQFNLEKKYQQDIEKSIVSLLEPVVGKNKVKSSVNVDLDFDSKEKTETVIDPNKVIVSQETSKENNKPGSQETTNSPVDNNMGATIEETNTGSVSSKEDVKTNYESGKIETKTISAPGEVKRLTASVFIDGEIDANVQSAIEKSVANAIGLNSERGDSVSVVGMAFDPVLKEEVQSEFDAMNESSLSKNKSKVVLYSILGILALIACIIAFVFIIKKSKNKKNEEENENLLDVVIDDEISIDNEINSKSIDFEPTNPKVKMENEIKKYATEKPEQVVDIIKSWLVENEG